MFDVYILESASSGKYYVGHGRDVQVRLKQHNAGRSPYTKNRGPWKLVYRETHSSRSEAMKREKAIKSRKSKKYIEQLIQSQRSVG